MADIKAGEPFGMDGAMLAKIDWNLALKRVIHDLRTDFIYAPHLGFIYSKAGDELIAQVKSSRRGDPRQCAGTGVRLCAKGTAASLAPGSTWKRSRACRPSLPAGRSRILAGFRISCSGRQRGLTLLSTADAAHRRRKSGEGHEAERYEPTDRDREPTVTQSDRNDDPVPLPRL